MFRVRDAFATVAAGRRITCHRNEPTEEKAGYRDKYEIDDKLAGPVGGLEVGVERHLLRVGIAPYIQRPIVARAVSRATFCFPRFWISSSSSRGYFYIPRCAAQVQREPCVLNSSAMRTNGETERTRIVRNIARVLAYSPQIDAI